MTNDDLNQLEPLEQRRQFMKLAYQKCDDLTKVLAMLVELLDYLPSPTDMDWLADELTDSNHSYSYKQSRYVYLITDGTYAKIGMSSNPSGRLKEFQTGNPLPLKLYATYHSILPEAHEERFHRKFVHIHVRGEWFYFTNELRDYFDLLAKGKTYEQITFA